MAVVVWQVLVRTAASSNAQQINDATPASATENIAIEALPPGVMIETAFQNARNPVAIAFIPDGRWLFTERTTGWVKLIAGTQVYNFFHAQAIGGLEDERGLIGVTVDPNFASNNYIYVYYTSAEAIVSTGKYDNRIVRVHMQGNAALESTTILTVPLESNQTMIHNGGNMRFGPDGKLYVSIGDYFNDKNGQDLNTMPAKIHRFKLTQPLSAASDNPFFSNPNVSTKSIYAYGFRNPFDFDFDPISGAIFAGENGIGCDDEVNRVLPGYNYGWRKNYPTCEDFSASGPDPAFNTIAPFIAWPDSVVPTGVMFYRGNLIPEWKNDLFVCLWKQGELHHFKLNVARNAIVDHTIIDGVLCSTDIENGTDGAMYYTSNDPADPFKEFRDIMRVTRSATLYASTFTPDTTIPSAGDVLTYTMRLAHYGTLTTTYAVTTTLPPSTTLIAGSLQSNGGSIGTSGNNIHWNGSIIPNAVLTATYQVTISDQISAPRLLNSTLSLTSNPAGSLQLDAPVIVNGRAIFLPVVQRVFAP